MADLYEFEINPLPGATVPNIYLGKSNVFVPFNNKDEAIEYATCAIEDLNYYNPLPNTANEDKAEQIYRLFQPYLQALVQNDPDFYINAKKDKTWRDNVISRNEKDLKKLCKGYKNAYNICKAILIQSIGLINDYAPVTFQACLKALIRMEITDRDSVKGIEIKHNINWNSDKTEVKNSSFIITIRSRLTQPSDLEPHDLFIDTGISMIWVM